MKFFVKDFFSKWDQIRKKLRIWSYLLKKSLMENFIFCASAETILSLNLCCFPMQLVLETLTRNKEKIFFPSY